MQSKYVLVLGRNSLRNFETPWFMSLGRTWANLIVEPNERDIEIIVRSVKDTMDNIKNSKLEGK